MSTIDLTGRKGTRAIRSSISDLNNQRQRIFFEGFSVDDLNRIKKSVELALASKNEKTLQEKKTLLEKLKSEIAILESND